MSGLNKFNSQASFKSLKSRQTNYFPTKEYIGSISLYQPFKTV